MQLPKQFTAVTPFSKYLAMVLFILFPFLGFYLGTQYQKSLPPVQQNISSNIPPSNVISPTLPSHGCHYELSACPKAPTCDNRNGVTVCYPCDPIRILVCPSGTATITPTQIIVPTNAVTTPIPSQRTSTCPPGEIDYGMPLGCISQEKYTYCRTHGCPICLSSETNILTSQGNMNVKNIHIGTNVWTVNKLGKKIIEPVIQIGNVVVPKTHHMIHLILNDGRNLYVSPGHPTTTSATIAQLKLGETYDNAVITGMQYVPYTDTKTYDILPAGDTGVYFANNILVGSTLH